MEYESRKTKSETLEMIGEWASKIRTMTGFSVIDIANMSGYSRGTIYSFEHGKIDSGYLLMLYVWLSTTISDGKWVYRFSQLLNEIGEEKKQWQLKD